MASHYDALVWIDYSDAKVFHVDVDATDHVVVLPHHPVCCIHCDRFEAGNVDVAMFQDFFEGIVEAISDAKAILITGPARTKMDLAAHIARDHSDTIDRVVGVETINYPDDRALGVVAHIYFKAEGRVLPLVRRVRGEGKEYVARNHTARHSRPHAPRSHPDLAA